MKQLLNNSLVLGLGKTGMSLINFFIRNNIENIYAWDDDVNKRNLISEISGISNIKINITPPDELNWKLIKQVIVSPGITTKYPKPNYVIELALKNGCKLRNDIDIFCELLEFKSRSKSQSESESKSESKKIVDIVAITGTNGKSTVTKMISDILRSKGYKVKPIGNIGEPVFSPDHFSNDYDFFCIEMSSFQLELCQKIKFKAAVLLDITPDHMDRYKDFNDYAAAKLKIFDDPDTIAIISINSDKNKEALTLLKTRNIIALSTTEILKNGFSMIGSIIYENGKEIDSIKPKYQNHNENILASYVCSKVLTQELKQEFKQDSSKIKKSIEDYTPIQHRLEFITKYKNVIIINDSKATNAEAASRALSLYKNIYWIAGGKIKEGNQLNKIELHNIRKSFFFGESKNLLLQIFEDKVECILCKNLEEAFLESFTAAINDKDDVTILFSPAHSSFDEFQNFEKRGDYFKNLVLEKIRKMEK